MFVVLAEIRMDDPWSDGALFVLAAAPSVLLLAVGLAAARGDDVSRAVVTIYLVTGLALAGLSFARLGNLLEGEGATSSGGTLTFLLLGFAALAWFCTGRSRSTACLLLAALASVGLVVEAVNWIFDTENVDTFRALLAVSFAILFATGAATGERAGTVLVGAAGVVALVTANLNGASFYFFFAGGGGVGWGWELVALAQGLALLAYAAAWHEPGPGYLAFFALGLFVTGAGVGGVQAIDGGSGGDLSSPTLVGWPLAVGIATVAATLWALRSLRLATEGD
jgi:hypothetical protein